MISPRWKWPFFAATAAFLIIWITTRWISFFCVFRGGKTIMLSQGVLHLSDFGPQGAPPPGLTMERVNNPSGFKWWFSARYFQGKGWIDLPLWTPFVPLAFIAIGVFTHRAIAAARARKGHCPKCNYDRRGLALSASCPECGAVVPT